MRDLLECRIFVRWVEYFGTFMVGGLVSFVLGTATTVVVIASVLMFSVTQQYYLDRDEFNHGPYRNRPTRKEFCHILAELYGLLGLYGAVLQFWQEKGMLPLVQLPGLVWSQQLVPQLVIIGAAFILSLLWGINSLFAPND